LAQCKWLIAKGRNYNNPHLVFDYNIMSPINNYITEK
jgi:hypothetical protein